MWNTWGNKLFTSNIIDLKLFSQNFYIYLRTSRNTRKTVIFQLIFSSQIYWDNLRQKKNERNIFSGSKDHSFIILDFFLFSVILFSFFSFRTLFFIFALHVFLHMFFTVVLFVVCVRFLNYYYCFLTSKVLLLYFLISNVSHFLLFQFFFYIFVT